MKKLCWIAILVTSLLSACLSGGGYMVFRMTHPNDTTTLVDYSDKFYLLSSVANQLTGDYEVVHSWGNVTYNIKKVSFYIGDDKVYILVYSNNPDIPNYKVEFSSCMSSPKEVNRNEGYFGLRNIGDPHVFCSSENRERSYMVLGATTPETTARLTHEEIFTSVISMMLPDKYIKVNSPYVMILQIWSDSGKPILALQKK